MKKTSDPPGFAVWLLSKRLPTEWRDFVIGDLEEEFASRSGASPSAARAWFWWQTIRCLAAPPRARPDPTKSRGRENLSFLPFDAFVRDVRYAFRTMRRQKTFTTLAVLCLALGIGANTTIFSLMDSILFRELPVEAPDELVILQWTARVPREGVPWAVPTRGGLVAVESGLRGDSWPYPMFASFERIERAVHGSVREPTGVAVAHRRR